MTEKHKKPLWEKKQFFWWSAIVGFLLFRYLILISAPTSIFDDEEMFNGTAALELLRGINLPLQDYMYWPHEGGALVMSFLTVPFLKVFGPNFVAMKLSGLLVSFITFILWLRVAWRTGGHRTSWCLALLFCLAPPLILKSDLMIWGHHNNVCLFIAAATLLLTEFFHTKSPGQRRKLLIGLGFVCGFGMFFAYIFAPMLVTVLITLTVIKLKERCTVFRFFLPTMIVGFLPWLLIRLSEGFPPANSIFTTRGTGFPGFEKLLQKGLIVIGRDLPYSSCFQNHPPYSFPLFSEIYFFLLSLAALIGLFWAGRQLLTEQPPTEDVGQRFRFPPKASIIFIIGLYCMIFLATFSLSPFSIELYTEKSRFNFIFFRYFLSLYQALFFLAALMLSTPVKSEKKSATFINILRGICCIGLVLLGTVSVTDSIKFRELGTSFALNGYSYERFGWRMYDKYCRLQTTTPLAFQVANKIDQSRLEDYYRGMGWGLAQQGFYPGDAEPGQDNYQVFLAIANRFPAEYRHFAFEGFGWLIMDIYGNIQDTVAVGQVVTPEYRKFFYRGVGWITGKRFFATPRQAISLLETIPSPPLRAEAFYGFGRVLGENRVISKHFADVTGMAPRQWLPFIEAGAAEVEYRYQQGHYMEGPVTAYWGGFTIGDYWY
ncbi:MAG: hypothetical protein KJ950_01385 [Proteobacteria bacterium]|nr:hypothetical protein [Pseudomonadota bacterium]MBU1687348.1 hypothetical protein [Pseudomonadota bacterium]